MTLLRGAIPIAVTELPVPNELLDRSMISRYDSKTAKDFYNA